MYCAFGVCFFLFSSLFRPAHCKNWNSCGFQKSVYIYTKIHASFSLWTSLNINNNNKKREEQQREQFQQQQKRREKFIGQIFSRVFSFSFCLDVLLRCFVLQSAKLCVCVSWLSRQANKSFWIARISFSLSHWFFMVVRSVLHFLDYSNAFTADEKTTKNTNISAFNRVSAGNYCRMD